MNNTRRQFLRLAGAASSLTGVTKAAAANPPNIVLILADDLGSGDLSSYGCPDIRTPNVDGIGQKGVRFTRFYANAPECTPTRTALLTGRYQHRVGGLECAIGIGNVGRYDEAEWLQKRGELGLPRTEATLATMLKKRGYDTAIFGKWHLGYERKFWPDHHGFDESFGILGGGADYFTHREDSGKGSGVLYRDGKLTERKGYTTDLIADGAIDWLKRRGARPFFLYLPFTAPHRPIQDPEGYDEKTGTAPEKQGVRSVFGKMVQHMDARIGSVLSQLDAMGAADNTIVIFTSDNGADSNGRNSPLRGSKSTVWEGGIRVPCLIRWPSQLKSDRECPQPAMSMDLAPTLLAAASASPGRKLDGVNLLPVLKGETKEFPRTLFWRYKRAENRRKAVRDGDLKYVIDNGREELFDLGADELEQHNLLSAAPRHADRLKEMLAAWEKEVEAPRLLNFRPQHPSGKL